MTARRRLLSALAALISLVDPTALGGGAASADEPLSDQRRSELARTGLNAFDEAIDAVRQNPARAQELYRSAAAAFETLAEHGVSSAALEYNLGNTYFRLGDLGRAVLHYRRGARLDPADAALNANLAYARNRVEPFIKPHGKQQLVARLMFWTNRVPAHWSIWIAAFVSVVGWGGLLFWRRRRSGALLALSCFAIALSLIVAGAAAWQLHDQSVRPHAVIIDGEYVLRLGRGQGYDPAIARPLGHGVELRVLSERADWAEVRLVDGQTGWLPAAALEKI